ncbi:MAG: hypothetical protein HC830_07535 [Bacteroidetes bacterium]|nr:hypothetical protein [Bacteroidota bacterium]
MKAKTSSYFEFDFTAGQSGYVLFRQGWVKFDWQKSSLLIGRNWHPLQGPVVPSTVSLNYGTPFNIFCRGEQIRYTYKTGKISIVAATFWQAGHASFGPNAETRQSGTKSALFTQLHASRFKPAGTLYQRKFHNRIDG